MDARSFSPPAADPLPEPRRFTIAVEGVATGFLCAETEPVLIAMERRSVKAIPVGCRGGGCGFCRVRVCAGEYVTGKMSRDQVTEAEEQQGYALACRIYPRGDLRLALARRAAGPSGSRRSESNTTK